MKHKIDARRRSVIRRLATRHGAGRIRWWPPPANASCLDLLVERVPGSVTAFRADLERALGCRVAVYSADHLAMLVEPDAL